MQKLWELLGKKITGEADAAELEELNELLAKYPEALYTSEAMESYWRSFGEKADILQREAALERHLQRWTEATSEERGMMADGAGEDDGTYRDGDYRAGEDRGSGNRRGRIYRRLLAGGAAVAAVFAGCLLLIPALRKKVTSPQPVVLRQVAATTLGERRQVRLPDGSTVWMNAGTTIEYIQRPGIDSQRVVSLSGEACFEIRHDAKHPFLVRTPQMDIRDLGTSFNVKAYPLDRTTEATLLEGMIDVRVNRGKEGMVLNRPHQKFTVFARPGGGEVHYQPDSSQSMRTAEKKTNQPTYQVSTASVNTSDSLLAETAWMKNMLVFQDETFEELAIKLERWYAIRIRFSDTDRMHYRFTGVLADESLEQALQVLQMMKPFHFTISGKTVHIEK